MELSDEIYPKRKEDPRTKCGKIWWNIERCAHNSKHFILRNKTVLDLFFIIIYLVEQLGFLYVILVFDYNSRSIAAIFIIILLSTMAVEKILMELRFVTLNKGFDMLLQKNLALKSKVKESVSLGLVENRESK
ncbi:MAG: hypothetical protein CMH64_01375 [Nanoarchaeota archaeon]|nr:hypothetical protein [Nanoarchaeota archaeon]